MAGNKNSGRKQEKPFRDALRMEIAALGSDDPKALRKLASKLLEMASNGDLAALREVADRTDGKPSQQVDIDANVNVSHEDALEQLE